MSFEEREDAEYVASATECTGLVPALNKGDDEAERTLYAVRKAKRPRRDRDQRARRS